MPKTPQPAALADPSTSISVEVADCDSAAGRYGRISTITPEAKTRRHHAVDWNTRSLRMELGAHVKLVWSAPPKWLPTEQACPHADVPIPDTPEIEVFSLEIR